MSLSTESLLASMSIGTGRTLLVMTVTFPLEQIKTWQQAGLSSSTYRIAQEIFSSSGIRGFYTGFFWQASSLAIKQLWRWPLMTSIPVYLEQNRCDSLHTQQLTTSAALSTFEAALLNPLTKLRILSGTRRPLFSLSTLAKEGWQGTGSNWLRAFSMWSSFLVSQEVLRKWHKGSAASLTQWQFIQISLETSCLVTLISTPFDTAATHRYLHGTSVRNFFKTTALKKMYRGSMAAFPATFIHSYATMLGLEYWNTQFRPTT